MSKSMRIEFVCVFWVSLALLVRCLYIRALLDGELMKAQGNKWAPVEAGKSERQKGSLDTASIRYFWVGLGWPPPWGERFFKLAN